jgi:hypothetical protein
MSSPHLDRLLESSAIVPQLWHCGADPEGIAKTSAGRVDDIVPYQRRDDNEPPPSR